MKFLRFFHRLGCFGYVLLGLLFSILLIPAAYLIFQTEDESIIAMASYLGLIIVALLAVFVVLRRNLDLLVSVLLWVPVYFVSYFAIFFSFDTVGNGYRLSSNPEFQEWGGAFYSFCAYQVPLLASYIARNLRNRTGLFKANIARMKNKKDIPGLIRALKDQNEETRREAVLALREVGDERVVDPMIEALEDNNAIVRRLAAQVLQKFGGERAFAPLVAALQDPDVLVASTAADLLASTQNAEAVDPLLSALQSRRPLVSDSAAEGLGHLGDRRAVEPLIAELDSDGTLQKSAARALVILGDPHGIDEIRRRIQPFKWRELIDAIAPLNALTDPVLQAWVAVENADWERVASLGEAAIEPLSAYLWIEENALTAINILAQIGHPDATKALGSRMNSGDNIRIRVAAARAMEQIGSSQAVDLLIEALHKNVDYVKWGDIDDQPLDLVSVQCAAAEALGHLGEQRAVQPLIDALKNPRSELFRTSVLALQSITGQDFGLDAKAWQEWWQKSGSVPVGGS